MKCDELKPIHVPAEMCGEHTLAEAFDYYDRKPVDDAIAELKQKLHDAEMRADLAEAAETERKIDYKELKAENRRLRMALWLARAERGRDNSILLPSKFMRNVWDAVERKCRAKAEQYK